ncbi:topless-related protein 4-like [Pyrus ussuriensis x Pyrus communis]|uniref:Topless-related protein 4-like n=1 Tax=Pyrus ussuriensis x Pyrus communis TaxID=2448454 RepID=A0A5N5GH91_9ROSA|nr:topless-related protein 4-like [Pyrus ussuriensis x Pyrus communis]
MTLRPGSTVKSMDFHPVQQILLLVGTNMGDVMVYELPSHEQTAIKNFKVWDLGACSVALQTSSVNLYATSGGSGSDVEYARWVFGERSVVSWGVLIHMPDAV